MACTRLGVISKKIIRKKNEEWLNTKSSRGARPTAPEGLIANVFYCLEKIYGCYMRRGVKPKLNWNDIKNAGIGKIN